MSPVEVQSHQRRRLFAAMVASVAERGYSASTLEEVCRISGVSRTSFYKFFGSHQACFLAAIDELQELGMAQVLAGYRSTEEPEGGIRAAFDQLIAVLVSQPAAAHMYVVDVYEVGALGNERVKRGLAAFEELLRKNFAHSPQRAGVSVDILAAIVAGVQMVIHDRLRRGAVEELPALATDLGDWALSYETPPQPLQELAGATVEPAATEGGGDVRARIVEAVAAICGREGIRGMKVDPLAAEARISLTTLYREFPGGAPEAFLTAFEEIVSDCLECSRLAYETEAEWPARMHAVNRELFGYLAARPAEARTVLVEVLGAGPVALQQRDRSLAPFGELLEGGQRLAPEVPAVVKEAIVFAVYALVGRQIEVGGAAAVPRLIPTATYIELAPYLGAAHAAAIANGSDQSFT